MKISCDFQTIKTAKRLCPSNPITAAMINIKKAITDAGYEYSDCDGDSADVVFVFGSITRRKLDTGRAERILKHRNSEKHIFSLDSGLFGTYIRNKIRSSESEYFRIGYGDCTGQGQYFNENSKPDRYEWFKSVYDFTERSTKADNESPILFLLQSEKGWMYDTKIPFYKWARSVVELIREKTNRHIILRAHPSPDRNPTKWISEGFDNISITWADRTRRGVVEDIRRAGAIVTHSSSAAVESYVEGIPTFALDERCVIHKYLEHDLTKLNSLESYDWNNRYQNLCDIANTSWHINELKNPDLIKWYIGNI